MRARRRSGAAASLCAAAWLCARATTAPAQSALPRFTPTALSAFASAKAAALLEGRLPCLGCHELGGEGGRIGPSLSDVRTRRGADYVYAMIRDPQRVAPGSGMPKIPMADQTAALVASYLLVRPPTPEPPPLAPPTYQAPPSAEGEGAALYARWCAACHGPRGGGDGRNARYLPVRPRVHADSSYMSTRSDDALFDTIAGGGYIMNRSPRMPPFGATLSPEEIRELVRYMRTLCRCQAPAWSRDDR